MTKVRTGLAAGGLPLGELIYRGAPETAQLRWLGEFDFQGIRGRFPSLLVLTVHSPAVTRHSYPPAEVTDRIFRPQAQGGFGVRLPRYVWESYPLEPTGRTTCASPVPSSR